MGTRLYIYSLVVQAVASDRGQRGHVFVRLLEGFLQMSNRKMQIVFVVVLLEIC